MTHLGLSSIMIEGGSRVLSTFLHAGDRPDGSKLVDSVIVTVAPAFIGEGVGVVPVVSAAEEGPKDAEAHPRPREKTSASRRSSTSTPRRWARTR